MARAGGKLVSLNSETYCLAVRFLLEHLWPYVDFSIDMGRDFTRYVDILRIRVPGKDGSLVYVTQEIAVGDVETPNHPPKLSDQTIATITLLLG